MSNNNNENDNNMSILSSIGNDIIGIMSPVSLCMFLVVFLVISLSSPLSLSSTPIVTAANLVYSESPSDAPSAKLKGALLNAAVFVSLIAAVTFLLVLLYYFNFTSFLKHYMRFSSFFVLGSMGGSISLSLIARFSLPIDPITFSLLLFNFTVIGVFSIFAGCVPILVKQGYMVALGIIVAVWFTKLPEWTTWVLLIALAVYDLVAVLVPGGPLKILVELASSRDDELPALVYEARPNLGRRNGNTRASSLGLFVGMASGSRSIELQEVSRGDHVANSEIEIAIDEERSPLVGIERGENNDDDDDEGEDSIFSDRGIRLGLGDFVFYSVLVGRAAMYDLMTVYACYLAIICGLGCTLILLAVFRHALPALPISIMLGVTFYFLTRLLMEPFVVGTSTNLMMF